MTLELVTDDKKRAAILRRLFYDDKELIDTYHISAGQGLKNCVNRTVEDMKSFVNYAFYAIKEGDEVVAFFGKEVIDNMTFMTGFFIKMSHRKKEFVAKFWETVREVLGSQEAYSSVYSKNTRAARFLSKKGLLVLEKSDILTFKIF